MFSYNHIKENTQYILLKDACGLYIFDVTK